jgi:L-2-hydroxyglutarate oxidase
VRNIVPPVDPPRECDFVVVGAGIVGLAVARELLSRYKGASLVVLEREDRIAAHQTGHSSGVIHSGVYYRPGSLKARLCVEGARELYDYCAARGIPHDRSGKAIVALSDSELPRLEELERRGRANRVPGLRRVGPDELRELEPHARGIAALHSPNTGVVDFKVVAGALAVDVRAAGGRVITRCEVGRIAPRPGRVSVRHARGETMASRVIACAGQWSDRVAVASGASADPRIVPFRGAYLHLRPERRHLVRASIYPVPNPDFPFLGIHLTREISGEVTIGPTALPVAARDAYRLGRVKLRDIGQTLSWPGTWRMLPGWWRTGIGELRRAGSHRAVIADAARYVPELSAADALPGPTGVRAQALARDGTLLDDFAISRTERAIHVRNAPSPAATSCLALARLIADQAGEVV